MTESRWRLDRTRRLETIALDQIVTGAFDETNPDSRIVAALAAKTTNILDLLQRYASAAERSYYRAHRELTEARSREKRNEAKEADLWIKAHLESPSLRKLGYPPPPSPTPAANEVQAAANLNRVAAPHHEPANRYRTANDALTVSIDTDSGPANDTNI